MDCPECGTPLVTYRLADREAPVCEHCGHVGIEAEHRAARARMESWSDALERFYGMTEIERDPTVPVHAADWDDPSPRRRAETWTEALERFYGGGRDTAREQAKRAAEPHEPVDESGDTPDDVAREGPATVGFDGTPAVRRTDPE